ncbi:MAG: hypothetical protein ACJAZR_000041 [Sediminicola sp.]|jgi:hypothetical protein
MASLPLKLEFSDFWSAFYFHSYGIEKPLEEVVVLIFIKQFYQPSVVT